MMQNMGTEIVHVSADDFIIITETLTSFYIWLKDYPEDIANTSAVTHIFHKFVTNICEIIHDPYALQPFVKMLEKHGWDGNAFKFSEIHLKALQHDVFEYMSRLEPVDDDI